MRTKIWLLILTLILVAGCNQRVSAPNTPTTFEDLPEFSDSPEDAENTTHLVEDWLNVQGDIWSGIIPSPEAHIKGTFSSEFDWPIVAIHAVLLPNGDVFTYGTKPQDQYDGTFSFYHNVWRPSDGLDLSAHKLLFNTTPTNLFCGTQTLLSDGSLMLIGGDSSDQAAVGDDVDNLKNSGSPDLNVYNYHTKKLTRSPLQMLLGRWYPTVITLASGELLVLGGIDENKEAVVTPELWNPETGWQLLTGAASSDLYSKLNGWNYPWGFVAPDGRVFVAGRRALMWYVDPKNDRNVIAGNRGDGVTRDWGSAVMYDTGKILVLGGGRTPVNTAVTIDINGNNPVSTPTDSMAFARKFQNATLLADGTIFVNGGSSGSTNSMTTVVYDSEIWDPETEQWKLGARASRPRMYHSTALLLPNGTVVTMGGDRPIPARNFNAEIYYPPYLFKKDGSGELAPRPSITHVDELNYDASFNVDFSGAADVSRVVLIRTGSVTHSFNSDQRFLELDFSKSGNSLTVQVPEKPELAPPGYYMLFIFDEDGVPSEAKIVSLYN